MWMWTPGFHTYVHTYVMPPTPVPTQDAFLLRIFNQGNTTPVGAVFKPTVCASYSKTMWLGFLRPFQIKFFGASQGAP